MTWTVNGSVIGGDGTIVSVTGSVTGTGAPASPLDVRASSASVPGTMSAVDYAAAHGVVVATVPGAYPYTVLASDGGGEVAVDSSAARSIILPDAASALEFILVDAGFLAATNNITVSLSNAAKKLNGVVNGTLVITTNGAMVGFKRDASGQWVGGGISAPGRLLGTTVLTAGTTFTTSASTRSLRVRMVGGGGGGGGCTSVAASAGAAGGGGAGGYAEVTFAVLPSTGYTYAVGAAGAGASGAIGGNGGDSTFAGATTVTAKGGSGGPVAVAAVALTANVGGAGGTISTNGDLNTGGASGDNGVVLIVATPALASGSGGSCQFGAGGVGRITVGDGNNAVGFGGGGGGAATGASTVRTGGNGSAGVIVVSEYS